MRGFSQAIYDSHSNPAYPSSAVFASDFGYNASNATNAYYDAIESTNSFIVINRINNQDTTYFITPKRVFNLANKTIVIEDGVTITQVQGVQQTTNWALMEMFNWNNVNVWGYGATLSINRALVSGESVHTISVLGGSNINIKGLSFIGLNSGQGGDGIYFAASPFDVEVPSLNVTAEDLIMDNQGRAGIAVITGENLTLSNIKVTGSNGRYPRAGIVMEGDHSGHKFKNITLEKYTGEGNDCNGLIFAMYFMNSLPSGYGDDEDTTRTNTVDITVRDIVLINNQVDLTDNGQSGAFYYPNADLAMGRTKFKPMNGNINIDNMELRNNTGHAIYANLEVQSASSLKTTITNSFIYSTGSHLEPLLMRNGSYLNEPSGSLYFDNVYLEVTNPVGMLYVNTGGDTYAKNITGNFTTQGPISNSIRYNSNANQSLTDNVTFTLTEGTSVEPEPPVVEETPLIVLNSLKAFPGAFGPGENARIDPTTANIIEVTNLNSSGTGSWKAAIDASGPKIVIVKVEGITPQISTLKIDSTAGNMALWGQFAPGRGLTINVERFSIMGINGTNKASLRHVTFQRADYNCTPNTDCYDAFSYFLNDGDEVYLDHLSARYSFDQTWNVGAARFGDNAVEGGIANESIPNSKATMAYSFISDAQKDHSTASISGGSSSLDGDNNGIPTPHLGCEIVYARNRHHNISHRFPNFGGRETKWQNYNNLVFNFRSRLSRFNGNHIGDMMNNVWLKGNVPVASNATNKVSYFLSEQTGNFPSTLYTGFNYHSELETNPTDNQRNLWQYFLNSPDTINGNPVVRNEFLDPSFYVNSIQNNFSTPEDGIWEWDAVEEKTRASSGHNRGINSDGSPGYFKQSIDQVRINEFLNGTSPSEYYKNESNFPGEGEWIQPSYTNTSLYASTSGDYIPDWFKNQHSHLNIGTNERNNIQVDWDFGEFRVLNNAGYTNLEMAAAFYAGDFSTISTGVNSVAFETGTGIVDEVVTPIKRILSNNSLFGLIN